MKFRIRDALPADEEFIARGNEAMALETEHKTLDPGTVRLGVRNVLRNPAHGRYFVAEDAAGSAVG
ncbi:MAG: GNAT family N-acetyltransferase, partial [Steroidobacteraceae bacterium]